MSQDAVVADLQVLAERLQAVQAAATGLPWAAQRPWLVETHLWTEEGVPTIDLHDLGKALARQVVDHVAEVGEDLRTGAVRLITGRGRHSLGAAVLPNVVAAALEEHAALHGWQIRGGRPGCLVLITDPQRAPSIATGGLGWGFWLIALGMGAAATWACPPAGIILVVCVLVWQIASRTKRSVPED